jgi:hypothetical protein
MLKIKIETRYATNPKPWDLRFELGFGLGFG